MSESSPFREFPSYIEKSPPKSRKLTIFLSLGIFVILVLTGLYFLGVNTKKEQVSSSASPVASTMPTTPPLPTSAPTVQESAVTPSPKVTIKKSPTPTTTSNSATNRADLKIAVLNGSGVAGAAKGVSSYLNGLGYTIKSIGNADDYTYKNITVRVNKSKSAYLLLLKKDLEANSSMSTVSASVVETTTADAEVIVGK